MFHFYASGFKRLLSSGVQGLGWLELKGLSLKISRKFDDDLKKLTTTGNGKSKIISRQPRPFNQLSKTFNVPLKSHLQNRRKNFQTFIKKISISNCFH